MSFWINPACYGCGICAQACPRGAIHLSKGFMAAYEIVALDCNDCGKCAIVCPIDAIGPDPSWAVCQGRGCPLTSRRLSEWACTETGRRCHDCGGSLWREPESDRWVCTHCDPGFRVACPKIRKHHSGREREATDPG